MSNAKITSLTALTTPADADVFPIVDVSDTTMAATGTTKKITVSSFFPASSTDNAIARFDGITGKVIQDSALTISDLTTFTRIKPVVKSGAGSSFLVQGGDSSDDVGGSGRVIGGDALSGDKAGGYAITLGGAGIGSGAGGSGTVQGGTAGATGAGGAAVVQGGAGGATSGDGGLATVYGGNATASDSNGGSIVIAPGNKSGSGINGLIALKESRGATYAGYLQLSSIASSDKIFTFPNETGTFGLVGDSIVTKAGIGATPSGNVFDVEWTGTPLFQPRLWVDNSMIGTLSTVIMKTDTGDPAASEGQITINTFDNKVKIYADGAWRQIATW